MWQVVTLGEGGWKESEPVADLESAKSSVVEAAGLSIVVPHEADEGMAFHDFADSVLRENPGTVLRVVNGINVTAVAGVESGCPGECFCVSTPGSRVCEAYYCNSKGACVIVGCPGSC